MPKENVYNGLFERAKNGEIFKNNIGSKADGTDKLTIANICNLTPKEVIAKVKYIVSGTRIGYQPEAVRRKEPICEAYFRAMSSDQIVQLKTQ